MRTAARPRFVSKHQYAVVFRLALRLHVDRDDEALHFGLQRRLDPVADRVRIGNSHPAGHNEVEFKEGQLARVTHAQVVRFDRPFRAFANQSSDPSDDLGCGRRVHQAAGFDYYTDMSLWDTFRTVHPLFNLFARGEQRDMVVSLVKMAEQGG